MTNVSFIAAIQISKITGAPLANVQISWPLLLNAFDEESINTLQTQIAAVATIAIEAPPFLPINEYGDAAYFTKMYENRKDLGNVFPGDGALFHGRGFIQLTWRSNYHLFETLLKIPLESNPDLALQPLDAAKIFALYFKQKEIPLLAEQGQWQAVRRAVNGGLNGWARFNQLVEQLLQRTDTK